MKFLFQFLPADAATVISSIATVCEDLSLSDFSRVMQKFRTENQAV